MKLIDNDSNDLIFCHILQKKEQPYDQGYSSKGGYRKIIIATPLSLYVLPDLAHI